MFSSSSVYPAEKSTRMINQLLFNNDRKHDRLEIENKDVR